jgi:hypothetical protein
MRSKRKSEGLSRREFIAAGAIVAALCRVRTNPRTGRPAA